MPATTLSLTDAVSRFLTEFWRIHKKHAAFMNGLPDLMHPVAALENAYNEATGQAPEVRRTPYENTPQKHMGDHSYREVHESFGMLSLHRVDGARRLYGSALSHHNHFIELRIFRGEHVVHEHGEMYMANGRVPIVEIGLSAAQFAEAITCMNVGDGVPCTIMDVEGVRMDPVPDIELAVRAIDGQFAAKNKAAAEEAAAVLADLDAMLAKHKLSKAAREEIRGAVMRWSRHVSDTAPYVLKQVRESVEEHVAKAKTEVEAFVTHVIHKLGVKALSDLKHLGAGSTDDEPEK